MTQLSVALWAIGIFALRFSGLGNLLLQVGLFFAVTIWNIIRPQYKWPCRTENRTAISHMKDNTGPPCASTRPDGLRIELRK